MLNDGRFILGSGERSYEDSDVRPETFRLVVHARDGTLLDTLGTWDHGSYGQPIPGRGALWVYPWFEAFSHFAAAGASVAVTTSKEPEVRLLNPEGDVRRIIRWDAGDRAVDEADIAAARREIEARHADLDGEARRQLVEPLLTDERPAAERFPTVASLEFGRDGRLWARRYPRPGGPVGEHWLAFEHDGRLVCELAVPEGFDPYEFGADYVLGQTRDELDVERVVMYGLTLQALESE